MTETPSGEPLAMICPELPNSRTIAGDDSSSNTDHLALGPADIMPHNVLSTIAWYVGRLKILTGIATLGAATAILALSGGRKTGNQNSQLSLRLVSLILAAFSLLFFTEPDRTRKSRT